MKHRHRHRIRHVGIDNFLENDIIHCNHMCRCQTRTYVVDRIEGIGCKW